LIGTKRISIDVVALVRLHVGLHILSRIGHTSEGPFTGLDGAEAGILAEQLLNNKL
jgi:hypothetical protein